jgi:hypothetical protein
VIIGADNLEANYRENKLYIKEGKERSQGRSVRSNHRSESYRLTSFFFLGFGMCAAENGVEII